MAASDVSTLFDLLPIGAYRSRPDGTQMRANAALVALNGYASEAELLAAVRNIGSEWYVEPGRRAEFMALLERDGHVRGFVSEIRRHKTRERIWISENAHVVRDEGGGVLYFEGTVEDISERISAESELRRRESELRQIAAQVPGVVFRLLVHDDGRREYLFVSAGVRELYGFEPAAVMADGTLFHSAVHPQDRERVESERLETVGRGASFDSDFRICRPDGEVRWVQLTSSPVTRLESGHLRTGIIVDVTARKAAEAALLESEGRFKLALESAGDGVWEYDLASGLGQMSARGLAMYGYGAEEVGSVMNSLDRHTHPDDLAGMLEARRAHLEGRAAAYVNEHRVRCKDGSWKWILSRGMVVERGPDGTPLRMVGTHTDISERRQAEALRAERDQAAAAQKATTQFLSRVSHELRTPLNAVLGFAQLLELGLPRGSRDAQWAAQILSSGKHLLALVDDVLDLSAAQGGQQRLELRAVAPAEVVDSAWSMLEAEARSHGLHFENRIDTETLPPVWADATRLKQVMSNLLSNAIKYNRPGGSIVVAAHVDAQAAVAIDVHDTGRGMDAAQCERLFQPFERLGAQHTTVRGTGLGLALTRQLVEAMGGSVGVRSQAGEGSVFTVRLPAVQAPRDEATVARY